MADLPVGKDKQAATASVEAIFKAVPKSKKMELIGEFNEALLYIQYSTPGK